MRVRLWCLVVAAIVAVAFLGLAPRSGANDQEPAPGPPLPPVNYSCEIPYDVVLRNPPTFDKQPEFDIYSWNMFLALNWPADTSTQGAAPCNLRNGVARDCDKPLPRGDYGPTVWETFKPDWAVFRGSEDGAIAPAGWNCPLDPLPGCDSMEEKDAVAARMPVMRMVMKDANTAQEFLQAGSFAPLIDQNGSLVRYELRMNEDAFRFVDSNKLWDSNNHTKDVDFQPVGSNEDKTMGPVEIKAAWKILPEPSERYHSRNVVIAWPDAGEAGSFQCKQFAMGLVGLHIAHKTKNAPQWIWSTFEHVDNYSGPNPSFADPDCPPAKCPPNKQPKAPTGRWSGDPRVKYTPPTQVSIGNPGNVAKVLAPEINAQVRAKLASMGSVWQYYELVSTQWPSVPYMGPDKKPSKVLHKPQFTNQGAGQRPTYLANTTMETYLMDPDPSPRYKISSCMHCHSESVDMTNFEYSLDFSYLLQEAYPAAASARASANRRALLSRMSGKNTAVGGQPTRTMAPRKK